MHTQFYRENNNLYQVRLYKIMLLDYREALQDKVDLKAKVKVIVASIII